MNTKWRRYRVGVWTLIAFGLFTAAHDFHYSRSDWHWNPRSSTWQVTFRVFTDDWEQALQSSTDDDEPLRLGDENQRIDANFIAHAYVVDHVDFQANGIDIPLIWTGMEIAYDITYIYLESNSTNQPKHTDIQVDMFRELYSDQANEVVFNVGEVKRGEMLTEEMPMWHTEL